MFDKFLTEQELNNFFIDFAEDAIYDNGRDSPIYIKVIFESQPNDLTMFENNINSNNPICYIKNLDIEAYNITKEFILNIRNKDYYVSNILFNEDGISVLVLNEDDGN